MTLTKHWRKAKGKVKESERTAKGKAKESQRTAKGKPTGKPKERQRKARISKNLIRKA